MSLLHRPIVSTRLAGAASPGRVNDEFGGPQGSSQIWPFRRAPDGSLSAQPPMPLNGSSIDNIERDFGSGLLQMGQ